MATGQAAEPAGGISLIHPKGPKGQSMASNTRSTGIWWRAMLTHCETVLVIDDHADLRDGLQVVLRREGYEVETAAHGREALNKLHTGLRPCVIVMDLMMPVMNGFEFREAQLADPTLASIPLIAYSGVTDPRRTAQQLHAAAYVNKPTEVEELASVVRQFCPRHDP